MPYKEKRDRSAYGKVYREANKDIIDIKQAHYRETHKDILREKDKERYKHITPEEKARRNEYQRNYYWREKAAQESNVAEIVTSPVVVEEPKIVILPTPGCFRCNKKRLLKPVYLNKTDYVNVCPTCWDYIDYGGKDIR